MKEVIENGKSAYVCGSSDMQIVALPPDRDSKTASSGNIALCFFVLEQERTEMDRRRDPNTDCANAFFFKTHVSEVLSGLGFICELSAISVKWIE
jgi:hypothetical protein